MDHPAIPIFHRPWLYIGAAALVTGYVLVRVVLACTDDDDWH